MGAVKILHPALPEDGTFATRFREPRPGRVGPGPVTSPEWPAGVCAWPR